jgi:ubiquinone/menaquinone biosynthesis C-methylase UbiE
MRKNAYAGIMGEKYKEAMKVLCPNQERAQHIIRNSVRYITAPNYPSETLYSPYTLLDLGCGGGEFIRDIESWTSFTNGNGRLKFTGVDNSPLMIERAREILAKQIVGGIARIVQADITKYLEAMNLVEQGVDIITSNFVLHNFTQEERERVFPLIYGALNNEGVLLMEDKIAHTHLRTHERVYAYQLRLIESLAKHGMPALVQPWKNHYFQDNHPARKMVEGDLKKMLRKVGFREVKTLYREKMEAVVEAKK